MKKVFAVIFAVILFVTMFVFTIPVSAYAVGDVDGNGKITSSDARLALRAAAYLEKLSEEQQKAADVDGSGKITAADARLILRVAAKLDEFDIPEAPETTTQEAATEEPTTAESTTSAAAMSNQEILDKYSEVVKNLKDNVLEYRKKEWQVIDDDYDLGSIGKIAIPLARNLLTSEEYAEEQIRNDREQIPVIGNENAVLPPLTGDDIKNAAITEKNGKTTIVIILKDEVNPNPAEYDAAISPSKTGAMFSPVSKTAIDDIVSRLESIAHVKKMSLTYFNCTATLVYDTNTLKVESLDQVMNMHIDIDMEVFIHATISGYATIINNMQIYDIDYKSADSSATEPTTPVVPLSNQEILDKYSEVVQNLKDNVLEYHKKEWQVIDDDYNLGTMGNVFMPIAHSLVTSEEYAEEQIRNDREQIPVIKNENAVLPPLTGNDIKKASITEKNGKTTIVIVLKDEVNPNPAESEAEISPSKTGAMFSPVSMAAIDDIASTFGGEVMKLKKISLTYHDCTATLVYDTNTLEVESFDQVMNIHVDVDIKTLVNTISGYAGFSNIMKIYDIEYK